MTSRFTHVKERAQGAWKTLNTPIEELLTPMQRKAAIIAGIGAIALGGTTACKDVVSPDDYCCGPTRADTTTVTLPPDTITVDNYLAKVPVAVEEFESATICPPGQVTPGVPSSRFEFELRSQSPFLLSNTMSVQPAYFSNGCPDQKAYQFPVSASIGHQMNLLLIDRSGPSAFHGTIVEGAYVTYEQANGQPGTPERGLPHSATHWKVQLARQMVPDAQGFPLAIRRGAFLVMRDRVTGQEYSSQISAEHRVPITGPYIQGTRLALIEDPANMPKLGPYSTEAQLDSALVAYVRNLETKLN